MTYEQTLAKLNILVYNGSYTTTVISNKSISYTISGSNDFTDGGITHSGIITLSVPYGVYSIEIAESTYHKSYTGTVEVLEDTTKEIHLTPYYNLTGSVVTTGAASVPLSNTSLYVYNSSSELVETITTDSNGNFTSDNVYLSGFTGFIRSPHIQQGDYSIESMDYSFTVSDTPTHVTSNINFSPTASLASKDVTFYVLKDGYTYQSSATKPTITVNGESQTVDPNGNTFSLPYGSHTVEVGSTNYNDSLSESITVSDSTSSYTYSVTGYYDLRVETKWYYGNDSSTSSVWGNNFTVKLYEYGNTSTILATSTSTSTGDAYFRVTGSYKINGTTTYYLNIPEQKLGDDACVVSNDNYVGLDYDNSDIQSNGHGDNQIYISYVLQLKTYSWQAILNRDGSSFYYTGITVSITNSGYTSLSYSATTSSGVAQFSSLPWGKYEVRIGSSSYSNALNTSCSDFDLTYGTFGTTFYVTGKYGVKFEVVGSNGSYIGDVTCKLYNSSDTLLTTGTTNSGGDVTFSSSYTLDYGAYFYVTIPSQTTSSYTVTGKTFYLYANTNYGSNVNIYNSSFYDYLYFRSNTVTVSAVSTSSQVTRSLPLTSSRDITETGQGYTNSYSTLSSYPLSLGSYGGYINNDSNHLTMFKWPLGGKVCWESKDWSFSFRFYSPGGDFGYMNSYASNTNNAGIRFGTSSSTNSAGYAKIAFNGSHNTKPTFMTDTSETAGWTLYQNGSWSSSSNGATISVSYSSSSGLVTYTASSGNTITGNCYPTLTDDSSETYLTVLFSSNLQIGNIQLTCYIK